MVTLTDLTNTDELRKACADVVKAEQADPDYVRWGNDLREFLAEVRGAGLQKRASEEFQRKIWTDNPVTGVGMGQVSVDAAIANPDFRSWLAERSLTRLPGASEARAAALDKLFDELEARLSRYTSRTPRLKIYRVLASFFPSDFTTVSHLSKLRQLHTVMFGNRGGKGPTCHANILRRLLETIEPVGDDPDAVVDRMRLPWLLFTHYVAPSGEERTEYPQGVPGEERLVPLPAARRRKGLTGVTDGRQALLNILEYCRDGATREDLKSHIKTVSPRLRDNSIATQINVIASELNCLKSDGDRLVLTDRGHAFLESDDSGGLMDWLVTRILGVDHALVILRNEGPCPRPEMVRRIKQVNPGWTSTWAPRQIVRQLREFDMLDCDESDVLSLSDAGREWAERIHWEPELLAPEKSPNRADVGETTSENEHVVLSLPAFPKVCDEVSNHGHFPEPLIRKLHAGIWANERRHFAVLTGLSGSGKTLLARAYGKAIAGDPRWGERGLNAEHEDKARALLDGLMTSLRPARLHFGWRVVDDVLDYMERVAVDGGADRPAAVLDDVVYAKVLPKLRGDDSRRFREALDNCMRVLAEHDLKGCQNKVRELKDDLESTGSARFWR